LSVTENLPASRRRRYEGPRKVLETVSGDEAGRPTTFFSMAIIVSLFAFLVADRTGGQALLSRPLAVQKPAWPAHGPSALTPDTNSCTLLCAGISIRKTKAVMRSLAFYRPPARSCAPRSNRPITLGLAFAFFSRGSGAGVRHWMSSMPPLQRWRHPCSCRSPIQHRPRANTQYANVQYEYSALSRIGLLSAKVARARKPEDPQASI